jgi:hypothetical protein
MGTGERQKNRLSLHSMRWVLTAAVLASLLPCADGGALSDFWARLKEQGRRVFGEACLLRPNGTEFLDEQLRSNLVGQPLAVWQLSTAIETHFRDVQAGKAQKALVVSIHGAPGVGKSYTVGFLKGLFLQVESSLQIDGHMYPAERQAAMAHELKMQLMRHVNRCDRGSLVVIEEVEQMSPGVLQELIRPFDHGGSYSYGGLSVSFANTVFVLVSNMGHEMLQHLSAAWEREREEMPIEEAQAKLQDEWDAKAGTVRFTAKIDFFVPYFPLEAQHIKQIAHREITARLASLQSAFHLRSMTFDAGLSDQIADRVGYIVSTVPASAAGAPETNKFFAKYGASEVRPKVSGIVHQVNKQLKAANGKGPIKGRAAHIVDATAAGDLHDIVVTLEWWTSPGNEQRSKPDL